VRAEFATPSSRASDRTLSRSPRRRTRSAVTVGDHLRSKESLAAKLPRPPSIRLIQSPMPAIHQGSARPLIFPSRGRIPQQDRQPRKSASERTAGALALCTCRHRSGSVSLTAAAAVPVRLAGWLA
jgi:hypothetical protein